MAEIVIKLVNGELAGKTMQEINKSVRESSMALSKAKVGTEEWIKAHQKLDDAKKLQGDLRKQIDATSSASDQLKKAWNKLPGAQYFNQIGESFGLMKQGVGGLVSSFGVLKTAIAATGIGLLVLVLGSLYTWFTKTEEGADKLKSVLYPLQVLFQKITGIVAELGGKIFSRLSEAINNPVQAFKDLGNAIVENVINRFKAFTVLGDGMIKLFNKDWKGGIKSLTDGFIQLGTGVTNATDKMVTAFDGAKKVWNEASTAGQRLLDLENAIEDAEVSLTVARAKSNVEFAKQMEIARDVTKSQDERLAAAKAAIAIQDQLLAQEENFLKLKLEQLKLDQSKDNIITDDERLERAKLEADLIQLQADNIDKKKKSAAIVHSIELDQIKESESAWKQYYAALDSLEEMHLQALPEGREKDLKLLEADLFKQVNAIDQNAPLYADRVAAAQALARQKRKEINDIWDVQDTEDQAKQIAKELQIQENAFNEENLRLLSQLAFGQITRVSYNERNYQNQKVFLESQLSLLKEKGLEETEEYNKLKGKLLALEIDHQEKIKEARQKAFDAAITFASVYIQSRITLNNAEVTAAQARLDEIERLQGRESEAYKSQQLNLETIKRQAAEKNRQLQKKQLVVNLAVSLSQAVLEGLKYGWPMGLIIGGLLAASAYLTYDSGVKALDAQKFSKGGQVRRKAALGGMLYGPSHDRGGIDIEAEGGEFIFSRDAVAGIGVDNLTRMNNQFAAGGPVDPFQGGSTNSRATVGNQSTVFSTATLENKIDKLISTVVSEMNARIDRIKVYNVVTETEAGIKTVNQIKADADC